MEGEKKRKADWPGLPPGWTREECVRQCGLTAGRRDVYYFSPEGMKIRSKTQLASYLGESFDLSTFDFNTGKLLSSTVQKVQKMLAKKKSSNTCSICSKHFQTPSLLKQHKESSCKAKDEKFYCDICQKTFKNGDLLHKHLRLHRTTAGLLKEQTNINNINSSPQVEYSCGTCGLQFQRSELLQKHVMSRTCTGPQEEFTCGSCGAKFQSMDLVQQHVISRMCSSLTQPAVKLEPNSLAQSVLKKEQDNTEGMFQCGICKQEFLSQKPLEEHIAKIHQDQFECGECCKMFLSAADLEQHIFSCIPLQECKCGECWQSFDNVTALQDHITSGLCQPNHEFVCGLCKCSFNDGELLQNHMYSH